MNKTLLTLFDNLTMNKTLPPLCEWISSACRRFSVQRASIAESIYMSLRHQIFLIIMMTSSNGNIFRVSGRLCGEFAGPGEFPTQRPVTRSFYVFFDLRLNRRLSKQPWGWWFETPSWPLWRQCNVQMNHVLALLEWLTVLISVDEWNWGCIWLEWNRNQFRNCADSFAGIFLNQI